LGTGGGSPSKRSLEQKVKMRKKGGEGEGQKTDAAAIKHWGTRKVQEIKKDVGSH